MELLRPVAAQLKIVVAHARIDEQLTLDLFRRGSPRHSVARDGTGDVGRLPPQGCRRRAVAREGHAIHWVMEAYRGHSLRPSGARPKVQLTPKETLIVSCVTQGMKEQKKSRVRLGTTEQVVKNYLRNGVRQAGRCRSRLRARAVLPEPSRRRWVKPPPVASPSLDRLAMLPAPPLRAQRRVRSLPVCRQLLLIQLCPIRLPPRKNLPKDCLLFSSPVLVPRPCSLLLPICAPAPPDHRMK